MEYSRELRSLILLGSHRSAIDGEAGGLTQEMESMNDAVNRQAPEFWACVCSDLEVENHVALLRGLVIAERQLGWSGGSVSGAIWVFNLLLKHRGSNPYVPLGSMWSARSIGELEQERHHKELSRTWRRDSHNERMTAQINKKRERLLAAKKHAADTAFRQDERNAVIRELEALEPQERFVWLARQQQWPPSAMPVDLFPCDEVAVSMLSQVEKRLLVTQLRSARGAWAKMRKFLDNH
jgi:hypothetical protein